MQAVYPNSEWLVKTFMHEDDGLLNVENNAALSTPDFNVTYGRRHDIDIKGELSHCRTV